MTDCKSVAFGLSRFESYQRYQYSEVEESGRPHQSHKLKIAGSNPALATKYVDLQVADEARAR